MWSYHAQVVRVVDADTIDTTVDLGFSIYSRQRFRLARIDAWEVKGIERPRGLLAKAAVEHHLPSGTTIRIETSKVGKYGRWIAEVWVDGDDGEFNLSDWLVAEGHAELAYY